MNDLIGFQLRISYWYVYRATYALLKQTYLHLKNILSSNKSKQQSTFKSKQQSMTSVAASTMPCTIWSSTIFKLFFIDAINGKFVYLFLLASLE